MISSWNPNHGLGRSLPPNGQYLIQNYARDLMCDLQCTSTQILHFYNYLKEMNENLILLLIYWIYRINNYRKNTCPSIIICIGSSDKQCSWATIIARFKSYRFFDTKSMQSITTVYCQCVSIISCPFNHTSKCEIACHSSTICCKIKNKWFDVTLQLHLLLYICTLHYVTVHSCYITLCYCTFLLHY